MYADYSQRKEGVFELSGTFADSKTDGLSKFDYETQLLEKMIRMKHTLEQMEERMNKTQSNVHTALQLLSATLDNKTAEIEKLEERVDVPLIAFNAYNPEDVTMDTSQKLILQSLRLNAGNGYDRIIGIFTAPVSGLYQFTTHICGYSAAAFHYYIMLEGTAIAESTKQNTAAHDCSTCSVITLVTKGQRVWIQCASGSSSSQQLYDTSYRKSSFCGVLIHKWRKPDFY